MGKMVTAIVSNEHSSQNSVKILKGAKATSKTDSTIANEITTKAKC
jgi:hypothetical protein